ncbi:MAG TPA: sulfite exporter TauE/SafE family protein [Mycobacteriales bacterium]|nr:sulfite exporter TauE/SafE family protein [Mycobacteriales bacterium]
MTPGAVALLGGAGFLAGTINAVAGGGSLISFPALLAVGVPSVPANVTNTVALWPGYAGSVVGYRAELSEERARTVALGLTSLVGAVLGAVLLLTTPASVFTALVPWLVLSACALLAVQPRVAAWVAGRAGERGHDSFRLPLHLGVLASSVYGAYFGAGLGVMLLGVLGILLADPLSKLNGLKNALSLSINTVALLAFVVFGPVRWLAVLVMAVTSLAGGFVGARLARRLSSRVLRIVVITFGVVVGVKLLLG